jgi:Na+/phosphate symporter
MSVVTDFESIGDIISRNLKRFNTQQTERSAKFSAEGLAELEAYQHKIYKQMCRITRSLESNNTTDALKVLVKEQKYLILENEMRHQHILRLSNSQAESIASHNMHVELMQMYKQVGVLIAGVATTLAIDTAEV